MSYYNKVVSDDDVTILKKFSGIVRDEVIVT